MFCTNKGEDKVETQKDLALKSLPATPPEEKSASHSKSLKKAQSKRHLPETTGVPESILKTWASQRQGLLAEKPPFGGTWFEGDQISRKQSEDPRMIAADLCSRREKE